MTSSYLSIDSSRSSDGEDRWRGPRRSIGFEKTERDAICETKFARPLAEARVERFTSAVAFIASRWVLMSTRSRRTRDEDGVSYMVLASELVRRRLGARRESGVDSSGALRRILRAARSSKS